LDHQGLDCILFFKNVRGEGKIGRREEKSSITAANHAEEGDRREDHSRGIPSHLSVKHRW